MLLRTLQLVSAERQRGRAYQPQFSLRHTLFSWLGGLVAIALLGILTNLSGHLLVAAPLGASTVLLFGNPRSPLAQPRNLLLGNLVGAVVSVLAVSLLGASPLVMGLAVGLTIALTQKLRCLHPPAGAVALLGVLLHAHWTYVGFPILAGSLVLCLVAVTFARLTGEAYPQHWC